MTVTPRQLRASLSRDFQVAAGVVPRHFPAPSGILPVQIVAESGMSGICPCLESTDDLAPFENTNPVEGTRMGELTLGADTVYDVNALISTTDGTIRRVYLQILDDQSASWALMRMFLRNTLQGVPFRFSFRTTAAGWKIFFIGETITGGDKYAGWVAAIPRVA